MKKLASSQLFNLKLLLNGEASRGFSKFKKTYKLKGELGRGGFGVVYRAVRIIDEMPVAVKFIDRHNIKEWTRVNGEQVPMEICMLAKCSKARGVIRLLDWYSIPEGYLIIMERPYPCVDMFDFIKSQGKLSEDMTRFLFRQIITTVNDCANSRVLHRDLKDENVIVDLVSGETKLIDFGAATPLRKTQYTDFQGTRLYCPPEWFLHSLYLGREAAVWSLGVLLYNSLNGRLPFRNEKDICTAHLLGPLPFFASVSQEAKDLIKRCLCFEPFKRCTFEEILNHPWLQKPSPKWHEMTANPKTSISSSNEEKIKSNSSTSGCCQVENNSTTNPIYEDDGDESGVGSSESCSQNKEAKKTNRVSKTSLLAPPTTTDMKAAVEASKTPTQYNQIKRHNTNHQKMLARHQNAPNSRVITTLRRAMTREQQKRLANN